MQTTIVKAVPLHDDRLQGTITIWSDLALLEHHYNAQIGMVFAVVIETVE